MSVSWSTSMQGLAGRAASSAIVRLRDTRRCSGPGDSQNTTRPFTTSMLLQISEGRASYCSSVMSRLGGSVAHAGRGMVGLLRVGVPPAPSLPTDRPQVGLTELFEVLAPPARPAKLEVSERDNEDRVGSGSRWAEW